MAQTNGKLGHDVVCLSPAWLFEAYVFYYSTRRCSSRRNSRLRRDSPRKYSNHLVSRIVVPRLLDSSLHFARSLMLRSRGADPAYWIEANPYVF